MGSPLFSQHWYKVADRRVRLRPHTDLHRHVYRGQVWYVLQDHATGQFHRFSPEAYRVIGLLDGTRPLQEVWEIACERLGDDMPTQDQVIELLAKLHRANVLQGDLPPDVAEVVDRGDKATRRRWLQQLRSPLGVRIPLWDPDRFLSRTLPLARPFLSWAGALLWLAVVITGAMLAAVHWEGLTANLSDRVLATENLLLLWLVYPVVKAVHELGHGYAVKRWGGEVHEMGLMLLVFIPVPYVEASAASAFRDKRKRMLVGAAGILVELFVAAVAMHVWATVEPGPVRALAFNAMIIAGVSTLLFNGNPLLRFDAYYVLSDFLEIPNLGNRGNQQVGYLLKRYLLGAREARSPATSAGEAAWLALYSLSSFVYRMFITVVIVLFVAGKYFAIGVVLALWSVLGVLVLPLYQSLAKAFRDPQLRKRPLLALTAGVAALAVVAGLVAVVPAPLATLAQGVVWPADHSRVHAGANGFVREIVARPGQQVTAGEPLVICEHAGLETEVEVLLAQIAEAEARAQASREDLTQVAVIEEELRFLRNELGRARERLAALVVRSPADGTFVLPGADDLPGSYLTRGTLVGYVVERSELALSVPVPQEDIDLIRRGTESVEVRFASRPTETYAGHVRPAVPAASHTLPSPVLSVDGGGSIALDPAAEAPLTAFRRHFPLQVEVPDSPRRYLEERAYVLFNHAPEPLVWRWYRAVRRVLLSRFDV